MRWPTGWHSISADEVAARLGVAVEAGLDDPEVARRREAHGANRLPEQPAKSAWLLFFAQFRSVLILVLLGAAALAATVGDAKDAAAIVLVVVLNAVVGFYQEHRAEQSLTALKKMLPVRARVRRAGVKVDVRAEDLVPGDVVLLEAGDRVPSDGRLVRTIGLVIDESGLSGESSPVVKDAGILLAAETPVAERLNVVHMNTIVTRGRGELVVTETGVRTEMGRISEELATTADRASPLQTQLDQLGKRLGSTVLILVGLSFVLELMRGADFTLEILDAIALAVAAVPEGLPVVVTVTLAVGMRQMARQGAILRRLASVETLGCTTVICSDKTGTLTLNQMTAVALYFRGAHFLVSGEGYQPDGDIRPASASISTPDLSALLVPLVSCNDSHLRDGRVIGDPTEAALLVLAAKGGVAVAALVAQLPRVAEIPFDSSHKFMATFHRQGDRLHVFAKGAPDVLLARCDRILDAGGERELDGRGRLAIQAAYRSMAARGLRGLLAASRTLPIAGFDPAGDLGGCVSNLTLVGLVGLKDPPRPEARRAIALCTRAGIAVKMITGDHKDTAVAVARELGLEGEAITGAELDAVDESRLLAVLERVAVFARVAPEHKVKIVRALQASGHVVAMTGDGVNDAPALKHADIGVAMGITGTEVAKEAAAMVLTDDNFATIVGAIRQGRTLYDNIVKFVRFQLSTTIGAILTVFCAPLAGFQAFNPIQILWVAMIMDGLPAVSLALDAPRRGIMDEPPRGATESMLMLPRLGRIVAFGFLMMLGTLGVQWYGLRTGPAVRGLTVAFTTFVLFQFFNVFNARAERDSSLGRHAFANPMLWWSLAGVVVLQVVAVHWPPAQAVFHTTALTPADWAICAGVASSVLVFEEGRKLVVRLVAASSYPSTSRWRAGRHVTR